MFKNPITTSLVGLALLVGWGWAYMTTSPLTATDLEQSRLDIAAPLPTTTQTLRQTFTPRHNGLTSVELLAVVYTATTDSSLTLHLLDAHSQTVATRTFTTAAHNAPLRLDFAPQPASAGQRYTLRLEGSAANQITAWAYARDGYAGGEQWLNDKPLAGDLRFITTYTYLWQDALAQAGAGLLELAQWAPVLWLLLFAPGYLLLHLLPEMGQPLSGWARAGLALAFSLSFLALVWLWGATLGIRWSAVTLGGVYGVVGLSVIGLTLFRWKKRVAEKASTPPQPASQILATHDASRFTFHASIATLFLISLLSRWLAARDLAFPPWVDSSHHLIIARLLAETGTLPLNYHPLLPVDRFYYHWGYHVLLVAWQWFTQKNWVEAMLGLGQILNALMPLAVYAGVELFTGRRRAAFIAAFMIALFSFFPGYYISWGRYTQLVGALIFAPLLGLLWHCLRPDPTGSARPVDRRMLLGLSLLCVGVFLAHYRILAFLALFVLVALAGGGRRGWRWIVGATLISGIVVAPWFWRLLQQAVWPLLAAPARVAATGGYNAFPWDYFKGDLERGWMVVAVLALCWGLARLNRGMWVVSGWLAFTFAMLNMGPGTWIVNNNAWAITLFLPGALAVGWGADQWLALGDWLRMSSLASLVWERMRQLGAMLIPVLLAGLLAYAGWRGLLMQINIPNPTTRLAWAEDIEALQWVNDHTPTDAVFAINGWQWLNNIWAGADGGAWLGPLTGRTTTLPPVDYTFQATWAPEVRDFNTRLAAITDASSPEMLALLQEQHVTHIYIGAKGGNLKPEWFTASAHYRLLYTNGAAWVFEVIYNP